MTRQFTLSENGNKMLLHNNYWFSEHRRNKKGVYWQCINYKKSKTNYLAKVLTNNLKKPGEIVEIQCETHKWSKKNPTKN